MSCRPPWSSWRPLQGGVCTPNYFFRVTMQAVWRPWRRQATSCRPPWASWRPLQGGQRQQQATGLLAPPTAGTARETTLLAAVRLALPDVAVYHKKKTHKVPTHGRLAPIFRINSTGNPSRPNCASF